MLTLMTHLALNIPGNPDFFECNGVKDNRGQDKACIVFVDNGNHEIPKYKIRLRCESIFSIPVNKTPWMIYPKAGLLVEKSNGTYICSVTDVQNL